MKNKDIIILLDYIIDFYINIKKQELEVFYKRRKYVNPCESMLKSILNLITKY